MSRLIFLIGMPGAGKTYWGRLWADAYQWQHIDLDAFIEQENATTIQEIFAKNGEDAFRKLEKDALRAAANNVQQPTIISCGGGTPVFFDNLDFMKRNGCVVYLSAGIDALVRNLQKELIVRPLLQGDAVKRLQALLSERGNIYSQSHCIYAVETLTERTFAEIISGCTNRHL